MQTPLVGKAAAALKVGDRVWFRHAKAGELCERFDVVHLIAGGETRGHRADLPRRGQDLPLRRFAVVVVEVLAQAHDASARGPLPNWILFESG